MKKTGSKLLILTIILAIFLAPISPIFETQNGKLAIGTEIKKAEAEGMTITVAKQTITSDSASFVIEITNTGSNLRDFNVELYPDADPNLAIDPKKGPYWGNGIVEIAHGEPLDVKENTVEKQEFTIVWNKDNTIDGEPLSANTNYSMWGSLIRLKEGETEVGPNHIAESTALFFRFKTTQPGNQNIDDPNPGQSVNATQDLLNDDFLDCDWYDFPCGLTVAMYYIFFSTTSAIAELAGKIMDFFIYYSTNSDSYSSQFIGSAWGAVRDIANLFFIIALLYVAIKTILGLNVSDNKKIIASIIIIALVINFSLFVTQVVIDSSNILAKVFYNQIKVENKDQTVADPGTSGEKKISSGLIVEQFEPQTIFMTMGEANSKFKHLSDNIGTFALVTIVMIAINIFMIIMFAKVAILFLSRVVGLWICMIFSPLAFASYMFKEKLPGFGHQEWWKNLLQQAFMAPIFVFFLYIIYLLSDAMKNTIKAVALDNTNTAALFMKVVIPFAIIFVLLKKAKDIAVEMSGELGKGFSKIQGYVTGTAGLGMVAGYLGQKGLKGASALGQKTIGAGSRAISRNISSKTAVGRFWKNRFGDIGDSSFNVGKIIPFKSKMGLKDTKSKYKNIGEREAAIKEKRDKRAKQYEVKPYEKEAVEARQAKVELENAKTTVGAREDIVGKDIVNGQIVNLTGNLFALGKASDRLANGLTKAERELNDAKTNWEAEQRKDPKSKATQDAKDEYDKKLKARKTINDAITDHKVTIKEAEKPIHDAELISIQADNALAKKNKENIEPYAKSLGKKHWWKYARVGGMTGYEQSGDEIQIRTASQNVQKAAPTKK